MNRQDILKSYLALGGEVSARRRREAYKRYADSFRKTSGTKVKSKGNGINLFDGGGDTDDDSSDDSRFNFGGMFNAGQTALSLINTGIQNAKLDVNPNDVLKGQNWQYSGFKQNLDNLSDNDSLLNAWGNMSYMKDNYTGKDLRNRSWGQDILSNIGSSLQGAKAGFGASGNWIGAVVGGFAGSLIDGFGTIFGRADAAKGARRLNNSSKDYNARMDNNLVNMAEVVDQNNDIKRMREYMNSAALGGELSTHGTDFTNGLTFINNGGTHEANPLGGVPFGLDNQGIQNMVEEGEVVWNDYVFSDRLKVPKDIIKRYKLKEDCTFAEAVETLTKQSLERPNSPIDKDTNNAILTELHDTQEVIRQKKQQRAAKRYYDAAQQDNAILSSALTETAMQPQGISPQEMMQMQGMQMPSEPVMQPQTTPQMMEEPLFGLGGNLFGLGGSITPTDEYPLMSFFDKGGNKSYGTWKEGDTASNWDKFSRSGIEAYAQRQLAAYNAASTPEEKARIQQETIQTISNIQNGYATAYKNHAANPRTSFDEQVKQHQTNWNTIGGNSGFTNIAEAQNLPIGADSNDTATKGWVDGLWGPQTSLRHAGSSTASPEQMQNLIGMFKRMGLDYNPTLEYGNNANKLYMLSMAENQPIEPLPAGPAITSSAQVQAAQKPASPTVYKQTSKTKPDFHDVDWTRLAPVLRQRMQALYGMLNNPDYYNANKMIQAANEVGSPIDIPVTTIGDYRRRKPFDERYLVNLAQGNRAAAMRSGMNTSAGNRAMQLGYASTLAHNNQQELSEIMRQAYNANRMDDAQVSEFNRGTNQFNAQSINQRNNIRAQLNASKQAQKATGLMQGYNARQGILDDWNDTTGQNISGYLNNLGLFGKERAGDHIIQSMADNRYFPYAYTAGGHGDRLEFMQQAQNPSEETKKCGGKINRKKKRRF